MKYSLHAKHLWAAKIAPETKQNQHSTKQLIYCENNIKADYFRAKWSNQLQKSQKLATGEFSASVVITRIFSCIALQMQTQPGQLLKKI